MLKELFVPTVAAVFGGLLTAAIIAIVNTPQVSRITAEYNYVVMPNPVRSTDLDIIRKLGVPITAAVFKKLEFEDNIYVVSVRILNPTERRSGNIEISMPNVILWHGKNGQPEYSSEDKISINGIDPRQELTVSAIAKRYYTSIRPVILEDGQLIRTQSRNIFEYEDPFGLGKLILSHPALGAVIVPLTICIIIIIFIMTPFAIYFHYNPEKTARFMQEKDVRKLRSLLAYITEHYPDKVA